MSDALRRAIRTFVQSFFGAFIASGVLSAMQTTGIVDWAVLQKAAVSAGTAGIIALLTWVINVLEDSGAVPSLLKSPASSGANPVPDDGGHI